MDFDETVRALDSFVGKLVLVYPVDEPPEGEQPSFMESGTTRRMEARPR